MERQRKEKREERGELMLRVIPKCTSNAVCLPCQPPSPLECESFCVCVLAEAAV